MTAFAHGASDARWRNRSDGVLSPEALVLFVVGIEALEDGKDLGRRIEPPFIGSFPSLQARGAYAWPEFLIQVKGLERLNLLKAHSGGTGL